jgi:deoxyribodipyrimidine photo-lyase
LGRGLARQLDAGRGIGASPALKTFLETGVAGYCGDRDRPDRNGTSKLSPHLRCGEISPRQVWHAARFAAAERPPLAGGIDKFLSELGWREFCRHLLFDVPNRVRMVAASFLVKPQLIDWRCGEQWLWDTLVDADAGSNPANWQWVAGSSADAAPYFRVFNPTLQGEKFDPDGVHVRRWVPCAAAGRPDPSALDGDAARTRRRRGSNSARPIPTRSSIAGRVANARWPPTPESATRR